VFSILAGIRLALIPAHKEVFEEVTQELQSNIFESESWAMKQLEQV
jgi:Na+/H+-dicarboxylate symporter